MLITPLQAIADSFEFGVIADCQYADIESKGARLYRSCPQKLAQAVEVFNDSEVQGVFHLGDFIDTRYESFTPLISISKKLRIPLYHVLGNHDYSVANQYKSDIHKLLGMPARYHSFVKNNWRFVIVDGNDVSTFGWPEESTEHKRNMLLYKGEYKNEETWNGGIGNAQLAWLTSELKTADDLNQQVVILSHFPIYPENPHNLWNASEVLDLVTNYKSVKAWFNGHNHAGNYAKRNDIHFVTFNAMLDTEETAFSRVKFSNHKIEINGTGKQDSMTLRVH
ncbi:metallophosphoesterase [Paraglaciecola chathamensis]|uniref:metallophosphoesterase n=1 Tax=Paraglaciecola chathamensis TaxID=368405 RepID=UPI00209012FF|nr:metallophosphoesterase [Paraglaciecola agarilytica]